MVDMGFIDREKYITSEHHFYNLAQSILGLSTELSKKVMDAFLEDIVRRISPQEASEFIDQLPKMVRKGLKAVSFGPDKSITANTIINELNRIVAAEGKTGEEIAVLCWNVLAHYIGENPEAEIGELSDVRSQLPRDIQVRICHAA